MRQRLGRFYYGFAGAAAVAVAATVALADAGAATEPQSAFSARSGYGADDLARAAAASRGEEDAVATCVAAASDRYDGDVRLAAVNRARRGAEGWIVDLSLDVAAPGDRPRRRDIACREGAHGLQVARY